MSFQTKGTNSQTVKSGALSRRFLMLGGASAAALFLSGCSDRKEASSIRKRLSKRTRKRSAVDQSNAYKALPNERFPIPAVPPNKLKSKFRRKLVRYRTREKPGTIVVDTRRFYLYHVQRDGMAMRYGVGLGRAGFAWSGRANIAWKKKWPTWTPPEEMIQRQPSLKKWSAENGGQPPGLGNALGARALYIHQDGKDTLYRLHGTGEINSIGKAVSSGCVRLVNQDVVHLYDNVRSGSPILVI